MARTASIIALNDLSTLKINRQEKRILNYVLSRAKPVSRRQIARALKMETSTVSARVNNMVKYGVLDEDGKMTCPISKKQVGAISC